MNSLEAPFSPPIAASSAAPGSGYGGVLEYYYGYLGISKDEEEDVGSTKKRKSAKIDGKGDGGCGGGGKRGRLVAEAAQPNRRLWVKDRSNAWWESMNLPETSDSDFRRAFRMSRQTFNMICDELSPAIAKEDTMLRRAIPVSKRVAICIWRLATGEPLRVVSQAFGVGISTCHKIILEVCSAVKSVLMPKFLKWPDEVREEEIKNRFFDPSGDGIPNVVGTMYTTQISIVAPKNKVSDYFNKRHTERNQRSSYSVAIQGIVDADGIFTDVCIGLPGSLSDDQVLMNSTIYRRLNQIQRQNHHHQNIFNEQLISHRQNPIQRQNPHQKIIFDEQLIDHRQNPIQRQNHHQKIMYDEQVINHRQNPIQRENQRAVIIGGKEYPLLEWLMVPYAHHDLTWSQHIFNEKVEEVRRCGLKAFGRLKGRWRCLQKRTEVKVEDLPVVLGACCVLHNVCEIMEVKMDEDLRSQTDDDDQTAATNKSIQSMAAEQVRNEIAHNLLHGGNLPDFAQTKADSLTITERDYRSFWMDEESEFI